MIATNASVAKNNPSRRVVFIDDFDTSGAWYPRYSPPCQRAAAPTNRKRSNSSNMTQVPPQNDLSATAEADARKAAATVMQRVQTAAARADRNSGVVLQTKNVLLKIKSQKTRAIGKAAKWEHAQHMANQALDLARADQSAAKRRADGYSLPRLVFECIMARLEAEPLLDVEKATRAVDKAERAYSFVKEETRAAREAVDKVAREERATVLLLRNAELAHARAVEIFHSLETAAWKAEERAVHAATAVKTGRCWENEVYAHGRGDKMDPLPAASELAASVGDSFIDDQVAPKAERPKH